MNELGMQLRPDETELVGHWIEKDGAVVADAVTERINWLTSHTLQKIATSKQWGAWLTLFQDLDDGRYWEQSYPQSGSHGGGPPALKCLSVEEAKSKYEITSLPRPR